MRILLISFYDELDTIGLKYVHYSLLRKGYNSSILYLPIFNVSRKRHLEAIKKLVLEIDPALIGISLVSYEYNRASALSDYLKSFAQSTPIIWGGIHPTISPEDSLLHADYVCRGEGERVIVDIADALSKNEDMRKINNLCYLEDGLMKSNSLYPIVENLDEVPAYEHIPRNSFIFADQKIRTLDKKIFRKYARHRGRIYSVMTSRGCPFSCTYCSNNFLTRLYQSQKIRRRSASHVIEELEKAMNDNPEIEYINFQDDCFLACSNEYLTEFCSVYKTKIGKPFIIRAVPVYITADKMKSLKESGLSWINLGLQSGSDRVLKDIYKRRSLRADFLKAARIVKDFKIAAFYDVILDSPFESEEDRIKTIETFMETPKPFYPQICSLTFFRSTEIYEKAKLECPEHLSKNHLEKDNLMPRRNLINNLTRLATVLEERHMRRIISLYRQEPTSLRFKAMLCMVNFIFLFILQPITYFKVIKLSQGDSSIRAFKVLPIYFKEGIKRYMNQFINQLQRV